MLKEVVERGLVEARKASQATYDRIGGDQYACGFAWVEVYVDRTNSKVAKELLSLGFRKDYKPKCLSMWNPGGMSVQNVDIKEDGAQAMAKVLRDAGLRAYAGSRLD